MSASAGECGRRCEPALSTAPSSLPAEPEGVKSQEVLRGELGGIRCGWGLAGVVCGRFGERAAAGSACETTFEGARARVGEGGERRPGDGARQPTISSNGRAPCTSVRSMRESMGSVAEGGSLSFADAEALPGACALIVSRPSSSSRSSERISTSPPNM